MTPRILIVDDESNILRMLRALLEEESYEVETVEGSRSAAEACAAFDPDLVLLDLIMAPGPDGIAVLERLKADRADLPVIMMSGKATLADAVRATKLGAFQFLEKPLSPEGVLVAVKAAVDLARARAENRALKAELGWVGTIVGASPEIEEVRRLIAQVGSTPSRVLITGESGTGKELVARAIHDSSPRRDASMVCVNCASVPRELVESELFGHEKGAFTGAHQRRLGKFELADKGTLFLDEVGDLDATAQAKLLRVLETGTIERVGGERDFKVDVRVVAATNKDLDRAVADAQFRKDLFYRLNVFPIRVPPLRERRGDIPALAGHFVRSSAIRCGRPALRMSPEAIDRLQRYGWPGNVRELANVIERLTIIKSESAVSAADVDDIVGPASAIGAGSARAASLGLTAALDEYEGEMIRAALTEAAGNIADAARRLKTDRANLYRRMKRLGLDSE